MNQEIDNLNALPVETKISLSIDEIKNLWVGGILNDTAYVVLVIKLNEHRYQKMTKFNTVDFLLEWQADYEDANGGAKVKTLKTKAVKDAIDKMIAASLAKAEQQLSLRLDW